MTRGLFALAGLREAESMAGDLQEEFALLRRELGGGRAWRWYAWQALRSVAGPLILRVATGMVVLVIPLALFDRMWLLVYTQLCAEPVAGLGLVNAASLLAGASLARPEHRVAGGSLLAAGLAAGLLMGPAAFPHIIAALLSAPSGALAAQIRKAIT